MRIRMMTKQRKLKLCPVCGVLVYKIGHTNDGRIAASCGDAFYANADKLGREYWSNHPWKLKIGKAS